MAAQFLDAMLQPAEPQVAQRSGAAGTPPAAPAAVRAMPKLTPLPSPFDTDEFQRNSLPVSEALLAAAAPRDSAFLGVSKQSTMQPSTTAASNGAHVAPGVPGASSSHMRPEAERQPGKDRRHSKWRNFGRGGPSSPADAEPSQDAEAEDSPQFRLGNGRDRSSKGRFSRYCVSLVTSPQTPINSRVDASVLDSL